MAWDSWKDSYDEWKLRSPDDERARFSSCEEEEECERCGGEGFNFYCFDQCCADKDIGCSRCTETCQHCRGRGVYE